MEKISIKTCGLYLLSAIISCTFIILIVATCTSCVHTDDVYQGKKGEGTLIPNESYKDWDYCGFNINNVVDTQMSITSNGNIICWIIYSDVDADFYNATISMSEETFNLLLEALDAVQNLEPYSKEWNEICDEYEFVILYKGNTNILIPVDKK